MALGAWDALGTPAAASLDCGHSLGLQNNFL